MKNQIEILDKGLVSNNVELRNMSTELVRLSKT